MHGQRTSVIKSLEEYTKKAMLEWHVPGLALAVVESRGILYAGGFGTKKLGTNNPVNETTVFQTGSITKTFAAALVAMLVDEGKLNWQDKVKNHLPEFRLADPLATNDFRVADLLAQRSGLPPHAGHLLPHLGFSRDYIIKSLKYIKPISGFRSEYAYQNNLFLTAAALVEKQTKMSWEQALSARILGPLNMAATSCTLAGFLLSNNKAQGHYYDGPGPGSRVIPLPDNWPHHSWVYTVAPAGGINSNVIDLANWLRLHLGRGACGGIRLISRKNINYMHTPQIAADQGVWGEARYYCLGWVYSDYAPYRIIWHNGGTSGMKSIVAMVPEADIGIVILCNLYEPLLPEALSRFFLDRWFKKPMRDWSRELLEKKKAGALSLRKPDAPYTPPRPLHNYTGTYYNAVYGPAAVTRTGNSLAVTLGPKRIRLKLQHWGGDTFVLYWPGVLTGGTGVQFYADKSNRIDSVEIEGMNDDLTGRFIRG